MSLARTWFVACAKRERQKHPCNDHPLHPHVSNFIFFLTEWAKLGEQWLWPYLTNVKFLERSESDNHTSQAEDKDIRSRAREVAYFAHSHTRSVREVNKSAHARTSRTPCVKQHFAHAKQARKGEFHTPLKNSYFRYKCEKVILSSCGRLRPSESKVR